MKRIASFFVLCVIAALSGGWRNGAGGNDITTHLYDAGRTGWNAAEGSFSPQGVGSGAFGLQCSRTDLDGALDAQPLYVRKVTISSVVYDVIYAATENNTVYAINAATCATIISANFGAGVDGSHVFGGTCDNNPPGWLYGIQSTPVIDLASGTLYVITATWNGSAIVHTLRALDITTLAAKVTAVTVAASRTLSDSSTYTFNSSVSRARPALTLANGNIYAGFASFCDFGADATRGWLLGWDATTLVPLAHNELTNRVVNGGNYYLSTIWMSGAGPAVDASGNLYFLTGNGGDGYGAPNAIQETAAKLSADLNTLVDYFTPFDYATMDASDYDFASGGITLFDISGGTPHLAVAAGKLTGLFLLNRDSLGGFVSGGPNAVLGNYAIGACWCAQNYYVGADNVPRILSNGGDVPAANIPTLWTVGGTPPVLTQEKTLPTIPGGRGDGFTTGFFSAISSNQRTNHVIWSVGHGAVPPTLYATDPVSGRRLFSATAGAWSITTTQPNLVPVVASGKVIVGSEASLYVFGTH